MTGQLIGAMRARLLEESEAVGVAVNHRVTGLIVDDEPAAGEAHRQAVNTALAADDAAVQAVDVLTAARVEHRVLKGIAHAWLDYSDPSQRTYGDADVLVRRDDLARALGALDACGLRRTQPAVRARWEQRYGKAIELVGLPADLDLHLTIAGGGYGLLVDDSTLWAEPETFLLGGRTMCALPATTRFVHACYHLALGANAGLRAMGDIAVMLDNEVDWPEAVIAAQRCRGAAVVAHALRLTDEWIGRWRPVEHPSFHWARRYCATESDVRMITASAANGAAWHVEGRLALGALPWRSRPGYAASLIWPSGASLAARGRTRAGHLRRMLIGAR
jgi:hypothetical protein